MVRIKDLKRINMLKMVPDHLLEIISQEAQLNIYGQGTTLFASGDEIDTFYMMIMGQVAYLIPETAGHEDLSSTNPKPVPGPQVLLLS